MSQTSYRIILLPGDGIGPEVVDAARRVMKAAAAEEHIDLSFEEHAFGGAATDVVGQPFPPSTRDACLSGDGILLGAVGGPKWDGMPRESRPEYGLLALRKLLGTYANLRPVTVPSSLASASPLRREKVAGTDLLVVRELTGGLYFGEPRGRTETEAVNTMRYSEGEVARIATVAFEWARRRRKSVVSVDKSNVLEVSVLWREVVSSLHQDRYADVELRHMYVDNAAMQIVLDPLQFDVVLTGNLFGDILSDLSGTLAGTLGMLPSACVGGRVGIFEPVHGSAPDIAGQDKANPVAAILSSAMLFEELRQPRVAERIRLATYQALEDGYRTEDMGEGARHVVGTQAMADAIADRLIKAEVL